jgi:hypothetical protein
MSLFCPDPKSVKTCVHLCLAAKGLEAYLFLANYHPRRII